MPRPKRDTAAGVFHVYTHCVWASPALFRDELDRVGFLRHLAQTTVRVEWRCIAYCLMGTHYHLIVAVEDGVLPVAMQRLNYAYAVEYNLRHDLRGHVQFARYGSRRIEDEDDLLGCFQYVAMNPVEAGLCRNPCDWLWSSYPAAVGLVEPPSFVDPRPVLSCFAGSRELAVASLRSFVEGA
jgi:REP element-mobilizing transposase RayT